MNLRYAVCSGLVLASLAVLGLSPAGPGIYSAGSPSWLGLLLLQLILELSSVPQMGFGFFSASFAATLALAVLTTPLTAGVGLLLALMVRQLYKGHQDLRFQALEFLTDATVTLVPLSCLALAGTRGQSNWLISCGAALVTYLPLSVALPEWVAARVNGVVLADWMFARQLGGMQGFAVAFLGPALTGLMRVEPLMGLFLVPVLFALHRASRTELVRIETMGIEALRNSERQAREVLSQTTKSLDVTRQQLSEEQRYRSSLEQLLQGLLSSRDRQQSFVLLAERIRTICPFDSAVLFRPMDGRLIPEFYLSASAGKLEAALLTLQEEPIVVQSFRSGQLIQQVNKNSGILGDEPSAVALPMSGQGILYLGRRNNLAFNELELTRVWQLTQLGAVALQSAALFSGQAAALEQTHAANRELNLWVEQLQALLEGSRVFLIPDAQVQFDRLVQFVSILFGCDRIGVRFGQSWRLHPSNLNWNLPQAEVLVHPVLEYGKPLLIDDLQDGQHASLAVGSRAALAVPLTDEEGCHGCLLLTSENTRAFNRFHQELLGLLAYQYTVVLRRTDLQQQVQQAQTQLTRVQRQAALSQLAADIAHEVNSPLAAVLLHLEALEKIGHPAVARKAGLAKEATVRSSRIVARWLYYCQEGLGLHGKVDVEQVVRDILDFSRRSWERAAVQPILDRPDGDGPFYLRARPDEVQQLVATLLEEVRNFAVELGHQKVTLTLCSLGTKLELGQAEVLLRLQMHSQAKPEEATAQQQRDFENLLCAREEQLSQVEQIVEHLGGRLSSQPSSLAWTLQLFSTPDSDCANP